MGKPEIAQFLVDRLSANRASLTESFFEKNPRTKTRFFVLDNVLPEDIVMQIYGNFPQESQYYYQNSFRERKLAFAKVNELENSILEDVIDAFQAREVIDEVEKITHIDNLEGDPSLYAGGVSRMDKSHFLNPHIDNSHDGNREKYRRLNLLFYVSPNIEESDGGNFELWDEKVTSPLKLASRFNRLIVMETNKTSWHSVDPVLSDIKRCCVSSYYFAESSPSGGDYHHVTSFTGRPNQTFRRAYGRVDNFLRQVVSSILKVGRGKRYVRER